MGAISGMGDTYDLPNFVGELFNITPSDTPLLSIMDRDWETTRLRN